MPHPAQGAFTVSARPRFNTLLFCVLLSCFGFSSASARDWKPTPQAMARDYAQIQDIRPDGELIFLMWFVPPMVAPGTMTQAVGAMLEKYVVIVAVHGRIARPTGTASFEDIETLEARDQSGKPLTLLARDALPPATVAMLGFLDTFFRQSLGAFGNGTKTFVFDAGTVRACERGGISVPLAGETYTWETPIVGCPTQ
jgi:hypothetical protein